MAYVDLSKIATVPFTQVMAVLPDLIAEFDADIDAAEQRLSIKGKTAVDAYHDQTAWPVYYGMRRAEVIKLLKYIGAREDACRGKLYRQYVENYSRDIGEKARERYIDNEPEYLQYHQLYLEIEELKDKFTAICDAFDRRGFALRDWTALRIENLHKDVI